MTDVATAEMLWQRAHEHMRRSDFANAVRDLANCFQILQALGDPRVYEVHKRWTEVHQLYLEDGQRQSEPAQDKAPSLEAEAESAANAGDLDKAIGLYEQISAKSPTNELVKERLSELRAAKRRAEELRSPPKKQPEVTTSENDWSDVSVDEGQASEHKPAAAPAMAPEDAPVGMQSLDVPFSVGEAIDSMKADELPVVGNQSSPPKQEEQRLTGDDPRWGTSVGEPKKEEQRLTADDPRWGTSVGEPKKEEQRLTADDPRWGTSVGAPAEEAKPAAPKGSNGVGNHAKQIAVLEDLLKRVERNRRKSA
jgi:hypothetical protein